MKSAMDETTEDLYLYMSMVAYGVIDNQHGVLVFSPTEQSPLICEDCQMKLEMELRNRRMQATLN